MFLKRKIILLKEKEIQPLLSLAEKEKRFLFGRNGDYPLRYYNIEVKI